MRRNPRQTAFTLALTLALLLTSIVPTAANASASAPRRVNVWPESGPLSSSWNTAAIFWFGQATSTGETSNDYVDVRITYDSQNLYVFATIVDYYLWYDPNGTTDPRTYDAFELYLDTHGDRESVPQTDDYYFVSGFRGWPITSDPRWQRQAQGTGSGWNASWVPSPAWSDNIGMRYNVSGSNNNSDLDYGWATTLTIPWATLGAAGPPANGTAWGIGAVLDNRNDQPPAGAVPAENWPETFAPTTPATWASLVFSPVPFQPAAATNLQTVTLRRGLNNEAVQDAYVGGGGNCGGGVYGGGDTPHPTDDLFIQNESDMSDFPCFSKSFLQFDLSAIPPGKVITGASLTVYEFGGSDPTSAQPSDIQLFEVTDPWSETTLTWNNELLAAANLTATWVSVLPTFPGYPGVAATWDASQLVADAYAASGPANLALYEADTAYNSGKYFVSSDAGDWDATGRPALVVTYGDPILGVGLSLAPATANQNGLVTGTVVVNGAGRSTQVSVPIPAQYAFVTGSATSGATYNGSASAVQWSGTAAVGTPITFTFQLQVASSVPAFTPLTASATDSSGATVSAMANALVNPSSVTVPILK